MAKKLSTGGEAQAELAIRYWVSNDCLQDTLFLLTPRSSYREAWITEHCLIGMWQPKLNHPYIVSFLKRSALGFRPNKRIRNTVSSKFGLRLWRKLRNKLHIQLQPEQFQLKRRPAWEILFNLTCFSRAPFEEARRPNDCEVAGMYQMKSTRSSGSAIVWKSQARAKLARSSSLYVCTGT